VARTRSPNYPYLSLPDAVKHTEVLWTKEKRTAVGPEIIAKAWGYKGLNGLARVKIASLKKYGLIDDSGKGFRVSERALRILIGGPEERAGALSEAALAPELFREIHEQFAEASDDAIRSFLVISRQFTDDAAKRVISAYRGTLAAVGVAEAPVDTAAPRRDVEVSYGQPPAGAGQRVYSWPLGQSMQVEVRFRGGELKASHFELLANYLKLARQALVDELVGEP